MDRAKLCVALEHYGLPHGEDYVDELPKVLKAEQRTKRMSVFAEPMDEKVRAPRRARARPAASERARP